MQSGGSLVASSFSAFVQTQQPTRLEVAHLQPPALVLPLTEPGLGSLLLLPVPLPLPLPALLLLPVLRLHLVEGGQLFPLQGQRALLLLLQEPVPFVAAGQGEPLQLHVAVPL